MKTIIGCLAAVFILWALCDVPQGKVSYGSVQSVEASEANAAILESIANRLDQLISERDELKAMVQNAEAKMREAVSESQIAVDEKINAKLVAFTETASSDDSELLDRIAELEATIEKLQAELKAKTPTQAPPLPSVSSYGSTGSSVASYGGSTGTYAPVVSYGSTGSAASATPVRNVASAAVRVATAPVRAVTNYQPRWKNYDGLSFRQHAEVMHGIDTTGLSDAEVGMLRDHDHDMYGGGHPAVMRSVRSSPMTSSCPGGVCPTGPAVNSGNSRWYLGKALGWRR